MSSIRPSAILCRVRVIAEHSFLVRWTGQNGLLAIPRCDQAGQISVSAEFHVVTSDSPIGG